MGILNFSIRDLLREGIFRTKVTDGVLCLSDYAGNTGVTSLPSRKDSATVKPASQSLMKEEMLERIIGSSSTTIALNIKSNPFIICFVICSITQRIG